MDVVEYLLNFIERLEEGLNEQSDKGNESLTTDASDQFAEACLNLSYAN